VRAIDTNVLVRFLTGDHPEQSEKARLLVEEGDLFVGITVFLESEWVLRSTYGFSPSAICRSFRAFAGLSGVTVENPDLLAEALDHVEAGMDFADALHLGACAQCDAFLTFDRKFARIAQTHGKHVVELV